MTVSNSIFGSSTLKYVDVISVISSEETHRETSSGSTLGSALNAQRRGRTTKRGSNSRNRGKLRGKLKGARSQSRGPRNCWYCRKLGHKKKDCWTRKNNEGNKLDEDTEANVVTNPKEMLCFFP